MGHVGCSLVQMQAQELRADLDRAEQRAGSQLEGPTSPAQPSPASPDSACSMSTPLAAPERLFRQASASPAPTPPTMPVFPGTSMLPWIGHKLMVSVCTIQAQTCLHNVYNDVCAAPPPETPLSCPQLLTEGWACTDWTLFTPWHKSYESHWLSQGQHFLPSGVLKSVLLAAGS